MNDKLKVSIVRLFRVHSDQIAPICFSLCLYRAHNRVERFFNSVRQCRRVVMRYATIVASYLALIQLASRRLWLRVSESTLWLELARH